MLEGKANLLLDIRRFIFIFVRPRQAPVETLNISPRILFPSDNNVVHLRPSPCTPVFDK